MFSKEVLSTIFWVWNDSNWDWNPGSQAIGEHSTYCANGVVVFQFKPNLEDKRAQNFSIGLNLTMGDTCVIRGARGVMVIVVGNGHGDTSSNSGRDWSHFA